MPYEHHFDPESSDLQVELVKPSHKKGEHVVEVWICQNDQRPKARFSYSHKK